MKVIMLDQDGVVCDKPYHITKNIKNFIHFLHNQDIALIPNSDTPVERLRIDTFK